MTSQDTSLPVCVIGAGVTGLTVAYRLRQAGRQVIVLEASERCGGNIRTEVHDGFVYDVGPDSFLRTKPAAVRLCEDLGLGPDLITPLAGASRVLVALDGSLHPMPEGLSLGVPKRPGPLLDSPLLSGLGKARALLEPFVPPRKDDEDESILQFTTRRLGEEIARKLAAPLLSGVFAGDPARLSMRAAFPQLVALEREHGSLFVGMNGGKSIFQILREEAAAPQSPFVSLRLGLGQLIGALCSALPAGCLHLGARVTALRLTTRGSVHVETGALSLEAQHVVFAGPPWAAAEVIEGFDGEAAMELRQVPGFETATVFFGLREEETHADLRGSGFIVPEGEGRILAATFVSSKWQDRAPPGTALVRAFLGGARADISGMTEEELSALALEELTRFTGPLGRPLFRRVYRYKKGTPQPELGHTDRLTEVEARLQRYPWFSLAGSGFSGVGIPDCVRQAEDVAQGLSELVNL